MGKLHIRTGVLCALLFLMILVLPIQAEAADLEGARQAILDCYAQELEKVDLSDYSLTPEELNTLFHDMKRSAILPWYCGYYRCSAYPESDFVAYFMPVPFDPAQYDYNLYEQTVAEILAETVHPGMSDWQIALSIHDYLVANCAYDESLTYRSGYDLLVNGTSVCAGYAWAYMDLLQRVGIPCRYISSEAMDHAWNLVQIGDNWYHVDVTWDDPVSDIVGRVVHKYFLLSDYAISDEEHEHYGWETDIACTDTTLDTDRFWHETDSQICYLDAYTSYVRHYTGSSSYDIYMRNEMTGELTIFGWLDPTYIDIGYGSYGYYNFGLSLWNGRVYYSDMEYVYSRLTDGSDWRVEYDLPVYDYYKVIGGSFVKDGTIYLYLRDHDNNGQIIAVPTLDTQWHSHSYTSQTVIPSCIQSGYTQYSCSCGITYTMDHQDTADHIYSEAETIQPADTTHTGLVAYTCTVCGYQITEETPQLEKENPLSDRTGSIKDGISSLLDILTNLGTALPVVIVIVFIINRIMKKIR